MAPTAINKTYSSSCHTEIQCSKLHHVWTISNFSLCQEDNGTAIQSAVFGAANGPQWILELYPNGCIDSCKAYISLFLSTWKKPDGAQYGVFPKKLKFQFSLLNEKRESVHEEKMVNWNPKDTAGVGDWGFREFLLRNKSGQYLVNDQLIISCCIIINEDKVNTSCLFNTTGILQDFPVPKFMLSDHLGSLFDDQKYGDTVIEVGDEEFLVCKQILQARSSVFAAMFEHEMEEQRNNRVIILDFAPRIVKEMLTYIYTDRSPNLQELANDLLPLADKYNLEGLKIMSERIISTKITKENAIEILILSDLHSASSLKEYVINFIITNGSHFFEASFWKNMIKSYLMKHPILIGEVTTALYASTA